MRVPPAARAAVVVFTCYVVVSAIYTHPVLVQSGTTIASDRYDPVLNASILWWNATTVPFSAGWWTPPHYYPSEGIAAFTENLVGLWPLATPLLWLTGDPLRTYNLVFFLTWPLSAFAAYLLVYALTRRHDAGFVAGLAFGFAPYRLTQIAHLQVLAAFWLPVALMALHVFSRDERRRWLVLFGAAWLLQSLTNGYFLLFGGLLIALWLVYFCSAPSSRRLVPPILVAWFVASLPLLPVLLEYRAVHAAHGLRRTIVEVMLFSAEPSAWAAVPGRLLVWRPWLDTGGPEHTLFPGITAALLVALAGAWLTARAVREPAGGWRGPAKLLGGAVALVGAIIAISLLVSGPWRVSLWGMPVRASGLGRPILAALAGGAALVLLTPGLRAAFRRRSPLIFYTLATLLTAAFCLGPQVRVNGRVILDPAPYGWLMALPGFDGLRVPTRFWMLGTLCLGVAAGLAFARLVRAGGRARAVVLVLVAAGLLADGWVSEMSTDTAPEHWRRVQRRDVAHPMLELPLGPEFDAAATYRAVGHRRRVVNGVSGYDPPHYGPLQRGLAAHDQGALLALTSFGPLDVVVDGSHDPDGALERYVEEVPGAVRVTSHEGRTLFRLPGSDPPVHPTTPAWPVAGATASDAPDDAARAVDGDAATAWTRTPQLPGQWLTLDLGTSRDVGIVVHSLGRDADGYPRYLEIHTSLDGETWQHAWEGHTLHQALSAAMRAPLDSAMVFPFAGRPARFVRLRGGGLEATPWSVAEVRVYAPPDEEAEARR